jgi:hypothetical protein
MLKLVAPAVGIMTLGGAGLPADMAWAGVVLWKVTGVAAGVLGLAALLALARRRLLAGRQVSEAPTWDCGYAAWAPRMQYTASSFADPILRMFRFFLRTRRRFAPPAGLFPASSSFSSQTPDITREGIYRPAFSMVESFLARFRWLQHGRLNLYILCIVLALLTLLAWKLR